MLLVTLEAIRYKKIETFFAKEGQIAWLVTYIADDLKKLKGLVVNAISMLLP
jgi:hypothetical protein